MSTRALVLFSGGQDSSTALAWSRVHFDYTEAIGFDYNQKHSCELDVAKKLSLKWGVKYSIFDFKFLSALGKNALTDATIEAGVVGGFGGLPSTFVPGRNNLFLTAAHAYAVNNNFDVIIAGVCETDFSGYPDCRKHTVDAIALSCFLATGAKKEILTPLMYLNKAETWELANNLGVLKDIIENTHTCYNGDRSVLNSWGYGCGECPACVLRREGYVSFRKNNHV